MSDDGPPETWAEADDESLPEIRRRSRRLAWMYTAAAIVLLPWIGVLAVSLPRRSFDLHYRAAWIGFDLLLIFAISRTAYMAFRVDPRVQFPATATATLLFVDAWFDMMTSSSHRAFFQAFVLAVLVEIPAALFSLYVARQVSRRVLELGHIDRYHLGGSGHRRRRDRGGDGSVPT
jgi:hypothetical protein